jgi:hypothetical protein
MDRVEEIEAAIQNLPRSNTAVSWNGFKPESKQSGTNNWIEIPRLAGSILCSRRRGG